MDIHVQSHNPTEESEMLNERPLRQETVAALRAALGGEDGADVTINPDTGSITIKDGDINLALSVPEILRKQEVPPKT